MTGYLMQPRLFNIIALTTGINTTVQFDQDHDYTVGEIISLRISKPYGSYMLNNKQGRVLALTSDTVTLEIDSQFASPFIFPVSGNNTPPIAVPSCSGIIPGLFVPTVNLEDAFDNTRV